MKYAKFLKTNDTIAVPAPSAGMRESSLVVYENAVKTFNKLGYKVLDSENKLKNDFHVSASKEIRAQEFMDMWKNPEVSTLISLAGGEFMVEILPYLNQTELTSVNPKLFQGFSDNTVLVYYLTTVLDIASIYHYNFNTFGMKRWHQTVKDSYSLLTGKKFSFNSLKRYESKRPEDQPGKELRGFKTNKKVKWLSLLNKNEPTEFEGRLIGGCLDILTVICGTGFDKTKDFIERYKQDGFIWYLETCDLTTPATIRALWQLKNAGWFEGVKGFIIGKPLINQEFRGITYEKAIIDALKEFNVPILHNADIGHVRPTIPVLNGSIGKVKYKNKKATITYYLK